MKNVSCPRDEKMIKKNDILTRFKKELAGINHVVPGCQSEVYHSLTWTGEGTGDRQGTG